MGIVLLVLVVGGCCLLLPLLIVFGTSRGTRGRMSKVPFLKRGNTYNEQQPPGLTDVAGRGQDDGTGRLV